MRGLRPNGRSPLPIPIAPMAALDDLIREWASAEERLFPIVMVRPEAYERYVRLVRAIADQLARIETPEDLAGAFDRARSFATAACERTGIASEGLDLDLAAGAGFCLRYREVTAVARRREAAERIRLARDRGDAWVEVLGNPAEPWSASYRRLEMHLPNGGGLHTFVEVDAETGDLRYGLEALRLDPRTGEPAPGAEDPLERRTFSERAAWEEAVEGLRRRLEGPGDP